MSDVINTGLCYIWTISWKKESTYTKTDGWTWINYILQFLYLGGREEIRTTLWVFEALEEWETYIIPVWISTFSSKDKTKIYHNLFIKNKTHNITTLDWEVVEID